MEIEKEGRRIEIEKGNERKTRWEKECENKQGVTRKEIKKEETERERERKSQKERKKDANKKGKRVSKQEKT